MGEVEMKRRQGVRETVKKKERRKGKNSHCEKAVKEKQSR